MDSSIKPKAYQTVDGARVPHYFKADLVRSSMNYHPKPDDIFVVTFPKCGTTWMEVILFTLLNNGQPFDQDIDDYFAQTPFLDGFGLDGIKKMTRRGTIKTHLTFDHVPYHPKAKYICVIRDPKDVCTSFYRFVVDIPLCRHYHNDFETFFQDFIQGQTMYGDYLQYLRSLWTHKDDPNVLLVSYEQMKDDLPRIIKQIADFIDIPLNDGLLEKVLKYSSFDYMKGRYDDARNYFDLQQQVKSGDKRSFDFCPLTIVQKGVVGGYRSIMSKQQIQALDRMIKTLQQEMPGLEMLWSPVSDKENRRQS